MPPQLIGSGVAEVCSSCSPGESHRPDGREKENRYESSRAWSRSWGEKVGEQQSLEQEQGGQPDHSTLPTASSALTLQTDAAAAETGASPLQESLQLNYNRDLIEEKIYEILKLSNLLLQSLQESFSPTHCSLLLISDQLFHLRAPSLNGADQLIGQRLLNSCNLTSSSAAPPPPPSQINTQHRETLDKVFSGLDQFVLLKGRRFIVRLEFIYKISKHSVSAQNRPWSEDFIQPDSKTLPQNDDHQLERNLTAEQSLLSNLLLQSLQESFSPTHCSLLLISDQLFHLRAPSLNGADQL
ncbi:hypothetical protein JZ751_014017, partial [Albula glossodonta]